MAQFVECLPIYQNGCRFALSHNDAPNSPSFPPSLSKINGKYPCMRTFRKESECSTATHKRMDESHKYNELETKQKISHMAWLSKTNSRVKQIYAATNKISVYFGGGLLDWWSMKLLECFFYPPPKGGSVCIAVFGL